MSADAVRLEGRLEEAWLKEGLRFDVNGEDGDYPTLSQPGWVKCAFGRSTEGDGGRGRRLRVRETRGVGAGRDRGAVGQGVAQAAAAAQVAAQQGADPPQAVGASGVA